jgi:hypothetical protein
MIISAVYYVSSYQCGADRLNEVISLHHFHVDLPYSTEYRVQSTEYRVQSTEYRVQRTE